MRGLKAELLADADRATSQAQLDPDADPDADADPATLRLARRELTTVDATVKAAIDARRLKQISPDAVRARRNRAP